jgi:hypothetical protein
MGPGSGSRSWGYVEWKPYGKRQALLADVLAVFGEYAEHRPLTIRQVFYRLVGGYEYAKDGAAYRQLCRLFDRARRAREIPFDWVRDDGIRGYDPGEQLYVPEPPEEFRDRKLAAMASAWREYWIPRTTGQPRRLELWCEAAGWSSSYGVSPGGSTSRCSAVAAPSRFRLATGSCDARLASRSYRLSSFMWAGLPLRGPVVRVQSRSPGAGSIRTGPTAESSTNRTEEDNVSLDPGRDGRSKREQHRLCGRCMRSDAILREWRQLGSRRWYCAECIVGDLGERQSSAAPGGTTTRSADGGAGSRSTGRPSPCRSDGSRRPSRPTRRAPRRGWRTAQPPSPIAVRWVKPQPRVKGADK